MNLQLPDYETGFLPVELWDHEIGACVAGIDPTASPTDCASSFVVRESDLLSDRGQIREYQGIWKMVASEVVETTFRDYDSPVLPLN